MKWVLPVLTVFVAIGFLASHSVAKANPQPRIVLVTGSTSGLGREVARSLVERGDHVIIHGRNKERGEALIKELNEKRPGSARFFTADFGSLKQVRSLAEKIAKNYDHLDVLVNNAGIVLINDPERRLSKDGYELHFQVNYLSGFLLSELLVPMLEKSSEGKIVNVASLAAAPLDFDNLMLNEGYSSNRAYGQSKLAQVMYTIDMSEKLKSKGITVNSLHPETYMNTSMILSAGLKPRSSVMDGRDAVLQLVNDANVGNGEFYNVLNRAKANLQAYDTNVRAKLWRVSEQLIDQASQ